MRKKYISVAALAASAALVLSACSPSSEEGESPAPQGANGSVRVGIKIDQPGLGYREGSGEPVGFEVDVAKYVAGELGYAAGDIEWIQAPAANRENALEGGEVDMTFASYSITDERKERVDFAGPYFVAGQDLLVRQDDTEIQGPENLNGKNLCSPVGTTSAQNIKDKYAGEVNLVEQTGTAECMNYLESGQVDAITTDDIILAGLSATTQNSGKFKVVGKPFTEERYGVGLPKGSDKCQAINDAITKMKDEGAWEEALETHFGDSGYVPSAELNEETELESCDT